MGGTHTHPQNLSPTEILKYNPGRLAAMLCQSQRLPEPPRTAPADFFGPQRFASAQGDGGGADAGLS
jgi:hypothetical protein